MRRSAFSSLPGSRLARAALLAGALALAAAVVPAGAASAQAPTITALASSSNPSAVGAQVTYTATVSPVPDGGTVAFTDGTATIAGCDAQPVDPSAGTATCQVTYASAGSHAIAAAYSGDTSYGASLTTLTQSVDQQSATSTTVATSADPSVALQAVTFTATVSPVSPATGTPTGTVTFDLGGTTLGTATLDGSGQAVIQTPPLAFGSFALTATYNGDTEFAASTSSTITQTVNPAGNTSTTVTSPVNPSVTGQTVTFTITVSAVPPATGTPTGVVQLLVDGHPTIFEPSVPPDGQVQITDGDLTAGTHTITAEFVTNELWAGSTSAPITQTVNQPINFGLSGDTPNPSVAGQAVTIGAVAQQLGGVLAPGTITIYDNGTPIGTTSPYLPPVQALTVSSLPVGVNTITASYAGDADLYLAPATSSNTITQTVDQGDTTTALTSSATPSQAGQPVTFTATVSPISPATGTATGTVTFSDGGTPIGTVALANGTAALATTALPAGTDAISAAYNGDDNFAASTSSTLAQVVIAVASTITTLTSLTNPSLAGQTVTVFATVSSVPAGAPVVGGAVAFFDNGTLLATPQLDAFGTATWSYSPSPGSHAITAAYQGQLFAFAPSTSNTLTQVVNQVPTATTLSLPVTSQAGQAVTFTAIVSPTAPSTANPSDGTVTFYDNGTPIGTGTVIVSGEASIVTSTLPAGSHTITATYSGDTDFAPSTSSAASLTVNPEGDTTTLTSSVNPSQAGQPVTFTATVSPISPATGTATGTVTFSDGSTPIGRATLNSNGQAVLATSTLAAGSHDITAAYSGDADFAPGTSGTATFTVEPADQPPSITSGSSATFVAGASGSFTVQATGVPGGRSISFTESGALPSGVTFTDNGDGTATLAGTAARGAKAGDYPLVITAGNGVSPAAVQDFTLVVKYPTTVGVLLIPVPAVVGVPILALAVLSAGDFHGTISFSQSFNGGPAVPVSGCQNLPTFLNSAACAFVPASTAGPGTYAVTASYSGDADYISAAGSASVPALARTSLALAASSSPRAASPLTVTAQVAPVPDGGTVSFQATGPNDKNVTLPASCTAAPVGTGSVSCSFTPAVTGAYDVRAAYSGDSLYLLSTASLAVKVS